MIKLETKISGDSLKSSYLLLYNITSSGVAIEEFYNNIYDKWESTKGYEEVYAWGYDTGGNYHWHGVYSGHHIIKKQLGVENE